MKHSMSGQKIIQSFQNYLKGKELSENSLSLQILPEVFINYYLDEEFDEVDKENDEDTLLFQYGIYGLEEEKYFQINFTRQLYITYEDDCYKIYQLGITFFYDKEDFKDIDSFTKWSFDCQNLEDFQAFITDSFGYKKALIKIPVKQETIIDLI